MRCHRHPQWVLSSGGHDAGSELHCWLHNSGCIPGPVSMPRYRVCTCSGLFQVQLTLTSRVPAARFLSAGTRQLAHGGTRRRHSMGTADFSAAPYWDSQELARMMPGALISAGAALDADAFSAQLRARANIRTLDDILTPDAACTRPHATSSLREAAPAAVPTHTDTATQPNNDWQHHYSKVRRAMLVACRHVHQCRASLLHFIHRLAFAVPHHWIYNRR